MRRSRGVSSSAVAISVNVLTTSVMRQGGGKGVESEPALGGAPQTTVGGDDRPSRLDPGIDDGAIGVVEEKPRARSHTEIHRLGDTVRGSQQLRALDGIGARRGGV